MITDRTECAQSIDSHPLNSVKSHPLDSYSIRFRGVRLLLIVRFLNYRNVYQNVSKMLLFKRFKPRLWTFLRSRLSPSCLEETELKSSWQKNFLNSCRSPASLCIRQSNDCVLKYSSKIQQQNQAESSSIAEIAFRLLIWFERNAQQDSYVPGFIKLVCFQFRFRLGNNENDGLCISLKLGRVFRSGSDS